MTNAEARFNKSLRPRKPEGSLGRTAQDVHLDSHTAPELVFTYCSLCAHTTSNDLDPIPWSQKCQTVVLEQLRSYPIKLTLCTIVNYTDYM